MDRPEVWMSDALTPVRLRPEVTARTAWFAWRSAVATEPALVCTPIDRDNWFGTPDTFPAPVTVILAPAGAGAAAPASARVPAGAPAPPPAEPPPPPPPPLHPPHTPP